MDYQGDPSEDLRLNDSVSYLEFPLSRQFYLIVIDTDCCT